MNGLCDQTRYMVRYSESQTRLYSAQQNLIPHCRLQRFDFLPVNTEFVPYRSCFFFSVVSKILYNQH